VTPKTAQLRSLVLGDDPEAWSTLGFSVTDPGSGSTVRLGTTSILLTASGQGFEGWSIDGVDQSIDGLPRASSDDSPTSSAPEHPNGIAAIDHVVLRTGDVGRTTEALASFGIDARRGRSTTSYGDPMRQVFFWLGDIILELVGPDDGEPTTDEPSSLLGLALVATDLDATVARLGTLAGTPKDAVQPGRRIAGIRGREAGVSLPLAVMSPHTGA
jgi:hypothetical protein